MTHCSPGLKSQHAQKGFTLLELLLVLGVAAVVMLGITQITRSWIDSETASGAGQHLARVSQITQKFIEARFDQLPPTADAVAAGGLWQELADTLQQQGLLPLRSPLGIPMQISYVVDTATIPKIYRASIFSTANLPNRTVLQAARQAGNTGGAITTTPSSPTAANEANGAFGQWQVPVTNLLPSGGVFPCNRTTTRGCLVAVISFNEDSLCGPYLYRNNVEGLGGVPVICTGGNTMTTALNMNGNDITSASKLTTTDLDVNGNANLGTTIVNGTAAFNGATRATNGLDVNGGMDVNGNAKFTDNVDMTGGGTLNATNLNADKVQAPTITTNRVNTTDMNVNGAVTVNNGVTVNGNLGVTGATSTVYANTVDTGRITANGGNMRVGTMTVQNRMNITGAVSIQGVNRTVVSDKLVTDTCVKIAGVGYGYPC